MFIGRLLSLALIAHSSNKRSRRHTLPPVHTPHVFLVTMLPSRGNQLHDKCNEALPPMLFKHYFTMFSIWIWICVCCSDKGIICSRQLIAAAETKAATCNSLIINCIIWPCNFPCKRVLYLNARLFKASQIHLIFNKWKYRMIIYQTLTCGGSQCDPSHFTFRYTSVSCLNMCVIMNDTQHSLTSPRKYFLNNNSFLLLTRVL